jgi:GGDEF domain-containing protein
VAGALRKRGATRTWWRASEARSSRCSFPAPTTPGAIKAAERVRVRLSTTLVDIVGQVTASMGVATWPQDGATEERLVWVADQRLYSAKEAAATGCCGPRPRRSARGRNHAGDGLVGIRTRTSPPSTFTS